MTITETPKYVWNVFRCCIRGDVLIGQVYAPDKVIALRAALATYGTMINVELDKEAFVPPMKASANGA